jgi:iron complex outermembrane receptor protein
MGSLDYYRAELSLTGPISADKKMLYRADFGYNEKGGTQDFAKSRRSEYSAAASYQFTERTLALLELSRMDNYASRQSPVVYLRDPVTNQYTGKLTEMFYFNRSGPSGNDRIHQDWMNDNIYGYIDHRFNEVVSLRVSGVWWERTSPALAAGGNTFVYTNSRAITAQNWSLSDIGRDNLQFLADLLAQYKTGNVTHKTLLSLTHSRETEATWTRAMSATTLADTTRVNRTINLDNPGWLYPAFHDRNAYSVVSRDRTQATTTQALFISQRSDFFDAKLKLFAGGRFDRIDNLLTDRLTSLRESTTADAFTPQFGLNYTPVKSVSFYANASQSYLPQSQVRSNTQELYPNEKGQGAEFGVKTTWFDGKLNFVLGVYGIERNNVLQTFFDDDLGMNVTNIDGQIKTDGVEFDFNWQVTPALQVIGGFGYMDNRVTRNDESPWVVGQLVARGPSPYNYGMALVYRLQSRRLNGLSLRADFSGQGESLGEYGSGPYVRNGVAYANDGRVNIKQPGYTIFNVGASYAWRAGSNRWRHSVSLNCKNLFDERYSRGNWIPADGFSSSITYSLKR